MTMTRKGYNWRKGLVSGLLGMVFGYAVIDVFLQLAGSVLKGQGIAAVALSGVGIVYLLIGLFVGLGTLFPILGAKVLNVSGPEDLRDQRAMLLGSSVSALVIGMALVLFALSGPGGVVPGAVALAALAFAVVLGIVLSIVQWRDYDELWQQLSWESSSMALLVLIPALLGWAALAHLGWAGPLSPLGVMALVAGTLPLGSFIASGRRGLLGQG